MILTWLRFSEGKLPVQVSQKFVVRLESPFRNSGLWLKRLQDHGFGRGKGGSFVPMRWWLNSTITRDKADSATAP